jgi:hypothetical protein
MLRNLRFLPIAKAMFANATVERISAAPIAAADLFPCAAVVV